MLVTSSVPIALLVMLWALTVRMPGHSQVGPIPPPSVAESELAFRLRGHVDMLADSIGICGWRQPEAVAQAAAYIARELRSMGYSPSEIPFVVSDRTEFNLEVTVPGTAKADEIIVVGAHYDTYDLTPGADDNASGVAGVLELARPMVDARPERTVRFVFFATGEPPYFNTVNMGSRHYAIRGTKRVKTSW